MISQEKFDNLEVEYGCGYWNVCWEHACPCAITTENKGLQESIYYSLLQEAREVAEQAERDDWEYERTHSHEEYEYEDDDIYEDEYYEEHIY